jgi:hypothetical protein
MKIIIDIRSLSPEAPSYALFIKKLVQDLSAKNKIDEWLLVSGKKNEIFGNEFAQVVVKNSLFNRIDKSILLYTLKKYQCSLYIKVVNYAWQVYKASPKGFSAISMKEPDLVVDFSGNIHTGDTSINKTHFSFPIALATSPVKHSWAEEQSVKTQYSGGKDYFIFTGDIAESARLMDLLKAFSVFKKWQQSNMLLLIAGYTTSYTPLLEKQLSTYKYKNDVVIIKNPSFGEQEKLIATAYAFVYPASSNNWPQPLALATIQQLAIISSDMLEHRCVTDTAIWVNNQDIINGFSAAMQLLYKDENQKQALVKRIKETHQNINYNLFLETLNRHLQNGK